LDLDQCSQSRCSVTASNGERSSASGLTSSQAGDHPTPTSHTLAADSQLPAGSVGTDPIENTVSRFIYYFVCICYRGNVFTAQFLSKGRPLRLHNSCFEQTSYITYFGLSDQQKQSTAVQRQLILSRESPTTGSPTKITVHP
jgi:hypothetical protein